MPRTAALLGLAAIVAIMATASDQTALVDGETAMAIPLVQTGLAVIATATGVQHGPMDWEAIAIAMEAVRAQTD